MTADLLLNTKLLSLGKLQQKSRLAAPVSKGASFWVKVKMKYLVSGPHACSRQIYITRSCCAVIRLDRQTLKEMCA